MDVLTIVDSQEFLRRRSRPVIFPDKDLLQNVGAVKQYLRETEGCFALASVQVGIDKRIIVIKSTSSDCKANEEKDWLILVNPKIVKQCGRTEFWESCASCLDNFGLVERPYKMTISYQDLNGKLLKENFEGFVCTVLSHEIDHLDGIFHIDRAKKLMQMTMEQRIAFRKEHPYTIYSKTEPFEYEPLSK